MPHDEMSAVLLNGWMDGFSKVQNTKQFRAIIQACGDETSLHAHLRTSQPSYRRSLKHSEITDETFLISSQKLNIQLHFVLRLIRKKSDSVLRHKKLEVSKSCQ
ncbi:hypothetical protein WUBG_09311 [Wuchereria bancrofti]|uniref:Uncharacterized protein n=1 Tax=Wuchereria bancrofti TaxID=6293 RepID=J9AYU0_WUCBA|nr:hypothetical protein WUBG_09311 [Wuchereria bancrofti]VDM12037.1 unnamed protein product [Wuchereria bancrofti]